MSRATFEAPVTFPVESLTGDTVREMFRFSPDLLTRTVS